MIYPSEPKGTRPAAGWRSGGIPGLLALSLVAMPAPASAQFTYTTNGGALTITGYNGPGGAVSIPSAIHGLPVTTIGNNAFLSNAKLTSVTLPSTVTNILHGAFDQCGSLTAVNILGNLTNIGDDAFAECWNLAEITFPDSLTSIGNYAFGYCSRLPSVAIPDTVTHIGDVAFFSCDNLSAFTVGPGNPAYSSQDGVLFDKQQATLIQCPAAKTGFYQIPAGVKTIGDSAFDGCAGLTGISIPDSVTSIQDSAFASCPLLVSLVIPDGVTDIEANTFDTCFSLTSVVLPAGITNLGDSAFYYCVSLTNLTLPASVASLGNFVFSASGLTGITLPGGITSIGDYDFTSCTNLVKVVIPSATTNLGVNAFEGCTHLAGVYFEGSAPTVDATTFARSSPTLYALPGAAGWGATLAGRPVAPWLPELQIGGTSGAPPNGFGFTITWASGTKVIVEASPNLAPNSWYPLQTNTLTTGCLFFNDAPPTGSAARFYRVRSP